MKNELNFNLLNIHFYLITTKLNFNIKNFKLFNSSNNHITNILHKYLFLKVKKH